MHDLRTIFRNSLLFCAIVADFCLIQIANADRTITYTVPEKGAIYGLAGGDAEIPSQRVPESWAVNSRKVRTTGYGAAASATASRASYGFIGRMTVSRAFFQAWLAYEIGSIGLEWIRQQYAEKPNSTFNPATLEYEQSLPIPKYTCTLENCYWAPDNETSFHTNNSSNAMHRAIQNAKPSNGYLVLSNASCPNQAQCQARYTTYNNSGQQQTGGYIYVHAYGNLSGQLVEQDDLIKNNYPAGEPTLDPDPYLTAAILDRWAHIVPEMRERVSDTVDFVPSPARYTEKDVLGNVLKDYEGVLEPVEEPILNPHKTTKRPAPEIEPTPRLKTTDLLNGNEITQPTEPIKEPTSETTTQTTPNIKVDIDLSKLEHTTTEILEQQKDFDVEYEPDDTEIEVPADLDEAGIWAAVGRLKVPVLQPDALLNRMLPVADSFQQQQLTSSTSATCPPPMTLTIIGGKRIEMPFDPICTFLEKVKFILVPLIGWIIALSWLKRINSH